MEKVFPCYKKSLPEGFVDGPEPAEVGHRSEEDEVQQPQAKGHSLPRGHEDGKAPQHVHQQHQRVDCNNNNI